MSTAAEQRAEIKRLKAENASLKAKSKRKAPTPTLKVSQKGAVSLYGIRRFPVTFYFEEWHRILAMSDEIKTFCEDENEAGTLTRKGDSEASDDDE